MLSGCGGFTPLLSRNERRFRSILENYTQSLAKNNSITRLAPACQTHHALLLQRHHAVLDPEAPAAHHVGQHHVRRQPVPDDGDLRRVRHARLRVLLEVGHDLRPAPGLLDLVREDVHAGALFHGGGLREVLVPGRGARGIGDDEQLAPGIGLAQLLKMILAIVRACLQNECFIKG